MNIDVSEIVNGFYSMVLIQLINLLIYLWIIY